MQRKRLPILFVMIGVLIFSLIFPVTQYSLGRLIIVFSLSVFLYKLGEYTNDKILRK
jgi:hypothetical protein